MQSFVPFSYNAGQLPPLQILDLLKELSKVFSLSLNLQYFSQVCTRVYRVYFLRALPVHQWEAATPSPLSTQGSFSPVICLIIDALHCLLSELLSLTYQYPQPISKPEALRLLSHASPRRRVYSMKISVSDMDYLHMSYWLEKPQRTQAIVTTLGCLP